MADATATQRRVSSDISVGNGIGYGVKTLSAAAEFAIATAAGSVIDFGLIPSNARILGSSRLYNDDLATTGSPTLDLGLFAVDSNITDDDDAIGDGHALSTANTAGGTVFGNIDRIGKRAWELVNGQTSDPGGNFRVKGTLKDAATTQAGTVALDLYYAVD